MPTFNDVRFITCTRTDQTANWRCTATIKQEEQDETGKSTPKKQTFSVPKIDYDDMPSADPDDEFFKHTFSGTTATCKTTDEGFGCQAPKQQGIVQQIRKTLPVV